MRTTRLASINPAAMAGCSNENHIARAQSTARRTLTPWAITVAREYPSEIFRRKIVEMKKENTKKTALTPLHKNTCRGCVWIREYWWSPIETSNCIVEIRRDSLM